MMGKRGYKGGSGGGKVVMVVGVGARELLGIKEVLLQRLDCGIMDPGFVPLAANTEMGDHTQFISVFIVYICNIIITI